MTVGALALVAVLAALALVPACSAHYQSDLGSLLRFGPSRPINDYYQQLSVTPARASWADLQAHFPVRAARFSSSGSCESLAKAIQEPFHKSQLLRNRPVLPWPAAGSPHGVPKALCRLGANVTRAHFDSLLSRAGSQKAAKHLRHYRVLRGRLYVRGELSHRWNDPDLLEGYEELLLLAVYLYAIPGRPLKDGHGYGQRLYVPAAPWCLLSHITLLTKPPLGSLPGQTYSLYHTPLRSPACLTKQPISIAPLCCLSRHGVLAQLCGRAAARGPHAAICNGPARERERLLDALQGRM